MTSSSPDLLPPVPKRRLGLTNTLGALAGIGTYWGGVAPGLVVVAVGMTIALLTGLALFRRGFPSILRAAVRG